MSILRALLINAYLKCMKYIIVEMTTPNFCKDYNSCERFLLLVFTSFFEGHWICDQFKGKALHYDLQEKKTTLFVILWYR